MTANARTTQLDSGIGSDWRGRAIAIAGLTVATTVLWLVARALGAEFRVDQRNGQPPIYVDLTSVIPATIGACALGWGALALLRRYTRRGRTLWTRLALTVLALSYVLLVLVGATIGTKIALFLMHSLVAAVLIPLLRRGTPESR